MIKIYDPETYGWEAAIRGMRNPMNSWDWSDSVYYYANDNFCELGEKDLKLMTKLAKAGSTHAKYRRMIGVTMDIIAPLYWWKEFDTYKVGTVANSCSTMHKIADKEFEVDDFSFEHVMGGVCIPAELNDGDECFQNLWCDKIVPEILEGLNIARRFYLNEKNPELKKRYWWQMIQLLPSSYNQLRTVSLNYEVLSHMVHDRKGHKLDEWNDFIEVVRQLPYAKELIFVEEE